MRGSAPASGIRFFRSARSAAPEPGIRSEASASGSQNSAWCMRAAAVRKLAWNTGSSEMPPGDGVLHHGLGGRQLGAFADDAATGPRGDLLTHLV